MKNEKKTTANYLKEYRIPFTVKITETEKILEKYSITQRKCRFKHELGEMKLFQKYSKQNCIFECKLEIVRKMCNCLPWYLDLKNKLNLFVTFLGINAMNRAPFKQTNILTSAIQIIHHAIAFQTVRYVESS